MNVQATERVTNGIQTNEGDVRDLDDDRELADLHQDELLPSLETEQASDPERTVTVATIKAIELFEKSLNYKEIAKKGYKHPAVKRIGGVQRCEQEATEKMLEARTTYLDALELPTTQEYGADQSTVDSYLEGVQKWGQLRIAITDPAVRADLLAELQSRL